MSGQKQKVGVLDCVVNGRFDAEEGCGCKLTGVGINPRLCAADIFVSIFHSFKAGNADANSNFKWWKKSIQNEHLQDGIIRLTRHLSQPIL